MSDNDINEEIRDAVDSLKSWLASRRLEKSTEDRVVITAPDGLRSIGFADLILEKANHDNQETFINCYDFATQKLKSWTELNHLVGWTREFLNALKMEKINLATLNLLRGAREFPISLAKYQVDECVSIVSAAVNFELGLDITHPETRGQNYAVTHIVVDDSTSPHDLIRHTFACLYSRCAVRFIVKTNIYYSSAMAAYLVDLMHQSGATAFEVDIVAYGRRDGPTNEKHFKTLSPSKSSKLSVVSVVFKQTDTFAAAQGIIEAYFRELYPNLLILVEESVYERFIQDWQRYYSNALQIGSRVDPKTSVVDQQNAKVQIDLSAIDVKASHKMSGNVINVLRYRTLSELISLLGNLRKVPYMSVWNDDILLTREFCLRLNQCQEFWVNHIPKSLGFKKFPEDMMNLYYDVVGDEMMQIYNSVYTQFGDEVEQLRKTQSTFVKKDAKLKTMIILQAYISMITKSKSLKNGSSVGGSVARLRRFQQNLTQRNNLSWNGNSLVESITKPVGMAMLVVKEEVKSKAMLIEMIFKNLLIGNAVMLVCPANTLGARFAFENDHVIPFKMVNEALPDMSRLTLDTSMEMSEASMSKRQCPKNTFAMEILPDMTNEVCDALTVALGTRIKSIWLPDVEQINYWSVE